MRERERLPEGGLSTLKCLCTYRPVSAAPQSTTGPGLLQNISTRWVRWGRRQDGEVPPIQGVGVGFGLLDLGSGEIV